jgi:hypothetical protein
MLLPASSHAACLLSSTCRVLPAVHTPWWHSRSSSLHVAVDAAVESTAAAPAASKEAAPPRKPSRAKRQREPGTKRKKPLQESDEPIAGAPAIPLVNGVPSPDAKDWEKLLMRAGGRIGGAIPLGYDRRVAYTAALAARHGLRYVSLLRSCRCFHECLS